jgi:colicin import membrane protein
MAELPKEARTLLAVESSAFVQERERLAKELREEGRPADASAVEELRKPPATVLAVNRAARDRPKAAQGAARAAERLRKAQARNDQASFESARAELQNALELLADVAIAHVAAPGKRASEAMRRRVYDLLRSAVADDAARTALVDGVLTSEVETTGFEAFAGVTFAAPKRRGATSRRKSESRGRERELRARLSAAKRRLAAAERSAREAEEGRAAAEREVAAIEAELERL